MPLRTLASRVVVPVTLIILLVMALLFGVVLLGVKQVAERSRSLVIESHGGEVRRILVTAVEDLVARELLDNPQVVEAKKKATIAEISAFWAAEGLQGAILEGERSRYASPRFQETVRAGFPLEKEGEFSGYRGLTYTVGMVTSLPLWEWRVVTSSGPVNIVSGNLGVILLIPAVLLSGALLFGGVWLLLRTNLEVPVRTLLAQVGAGTPLTSSGIAELDRLGERVNTSFSALNRRNQQMRMLHDIALALHEKGSFEEVCRRILREAAAIFGVPHLALALFRLPGREFQQMWREGECALPAGPGGRCHDFYRSLLEGGETVVAQAGDEGSPHLRGLAGFCRTIQSFVAHPMISSRGDAGLVLLIANKSTPYSPEDERLVRILATDAMVAYDRFRDAEALRKREEHYRTLTEGVQDIIFEVNRGFEVVYINRFASHVIGIPQEKAGGLPLDRLFPAEQAAVMQKDLSRIFQTGAPLTTDRLVTLPGGGTRWLNTRLFGLAGEDGLVETVLGISQDVTERRLAEQRVGQSLREKEALLHEVHHRVKNNLQVVSGMLEIAGDRIDDPRAREVLRESRSRVATMALIHERLYRGKDVDSVEMHAYLRSLAQAMAASMSPDPSRVTLSLDVARISLPIDTAIPCGLIVNELLTNAFKHAFPAGGRGSIRLELSTTAPGRYRLTVSDDGAGIPAGIQPDRLPSMGLRLIQSLTRQMGGEFTLARGEKGMVVTVTFGEVREGYASVLSPFPPGPA